MQLKKLITIQDSGDSLTRYFTEIRRYEPLTKEEEKKLIIRIQRNGDPNALDKLVKSNLKFVVSIAKQYQGQGSTLIDLISEGNAGMLRAIESFDTSKDLKFFSYAVWWIRLKMFTSLYNDSRTIKLPDNRALLVTRIKREVDALEQKLERYPSIDELHEYLKEEFKKEEIYDAILHGGKEKSINDRIGDESEEMLTLEDVLESKESKIDDISKTESLVNDLNRFFYNLEQKEYDVLSLYMGLNGEAILKSIDIAKALGMKEKEVNKLRTKALKRMKKLKNIDSLKDYL